MWPTCSAWPIKAKPLCPFFFSGTSSRVSPSSRPRTDLSSSRPFLSVPTFVPVSLFLVNSRRTISLSLSLPAHRKDYHTRNACLLASTRLVPPTIIEPTFSFPSDALSISFPLHSLSRFCSNVFLVRVTRLGSEYCFFENHRAKRRESEFYFFELYIFSLSR